jgi:hypothetical protein
MAKNSAKKLAKKPMAKAVARKRPHRPKHRRPRVLATTITAVVPKPFKKGGPTTEAEIRGTGLDTPGLIATVDDAAITIEQPLPDGVTAKKFPITITVLDGAALGSHTVAMFLGDDEVCHLPDAIEVT